MELTALIDSELVQNIEHNFHLEKRRSEKIVQYLLLEKSKINHRLITYSLTGKPLVREKGIHLSFSHSEALSALMVSPVNCGVDVEKENPKLWQIAPKFLNDEDQKALRDLNDIPWIWTIKEAIYKYFGQGVAFKSDILVQSISWKNQTAVVNYKGRFGSRQFLVGLDQIENYYIAFTNGISPD